MENFWMSQVFEIHHLILIICVLLVAIVLMGGGGKLLGPLIKKLLGREAVNINIGGTMPKNSEATKCPPGSVDPTKCPAHQAEKERSLRNEHQIEKLWENYGQLRNDMTQGFKEVVASINTTKETILSALAGDRKGYRGSGKGGED